MASADELRNEIETAYGSLHSAIQGASSKWQSAQATTESVLRNELEYAVTVAERMEAMKLPERKQFSLASQKDALSALEEVHATSTKVFKYVEDRDLVKATPQLENIGGLMEAAAEQASSSASVIQDVT